MRYVISYDLTREPYSSYQDLWDELGRFGARRVLLSQWGLRHGNTSVKALREHFDRFLDDDDRILVVCIDNSSYSARNLINAIKDL